MAQHRWTRARWAWALGLILVGLTLDAQAAGPGWLTDHDAALKQAQAANKPVIIDMWAQWCTPCLKLGKETLDHPEVKRRLDGFVLAKVDMDAPVNEPLWKRYKVDNLPRVFFLDAKGAVKVDLTLAEFEDATAFSARLDKARAAFGLPAITGAVAAEPTTAEPTGAEPGHEPTGKPAAATGALPAPHPALAALSGKAISVQPQVTARLVTDVAQAEAGGTLTAAVHLAVGPGWHVYWTWPGDAGLPTEVNWTLPEGATAGPLSWPAPLQFSEQGGELTTYGYADQVTLTAPITLAAQANGDQTLKASVSWLVCREQCIPGRATLETTIKAGPQQQGPAAAWFSRLDGPRVEAVEGLEGWQAKLDIEPAPLVPGQMARGKLVLTAPEGTALSADSGAHVAGLVPAGERLLGFGDLGLGFEGHVARGEFTLVVPEELPELLPDAKTLAVGAVVRMKVDGKPRAMQIMASASTGDQASAAPDRPAAVAPPPPPAEEASLGLMLLFAFIGGLLLNIMPCVLPVLSIKVLSLIHQAGEANQRVWHHGLMYTLGVLMSFWLLAGIVLGLKASGELVGWGFQFQDPWFVVALTAFVFGFGLSLFGVFEITLPGMQVASKAGATGGLMGSFSNGAFATLLATPCTAPFLGPALGYAFTQTAPITILFFTTVGLGLAFPFLLLARFPKWTRKVPKPGPWMETFKQAMGFLLMGTAVWLLDVLSYQVSRKAMTGVIAFLTVVALASWVYGRFAAAGHTPRRRWIASLAAIGMIVGGARLALTLEPREANGVERHDGPIAWETFSPEQVTAHNKAGRPVFIDFTAEWCLSCKANEGAVIETETVRQALADLEVVAMKADWTNRDPVISEWLRRFNRVGVPLYVVLPPDRPDQPIVLPEILTTETLIDAFKRARQPSG